MLHIGVTGTGSLVGQAIIKCIRKSAWYSDARITGFDYIPNTVGSYWVDDNIILPDITKTEIDYAIAVEAMIGHLNDRKVDILFIGIDFDLPMYAAYKNEIESRTTTKLIVNSEKLIGIADDKYETYLFLKEYGFTYPETCLPDAVPAYFIFPAILKPRTGASSIGVSIVHSREEMKNAAAQLERPVLQELIGMPEDEYTCGVVCFDGNILDSIVLKRKLKKGDTSVAFHRRDFPPCIYEYVHALAKALQPNGACNFQLRLDNAGTPKLFEINARHSGTTYFRCLFGYNEIEMILDHYYPVAGYAKPEKTYGMAMRYFDEKITETY